MRHLEPDEASISEAAEELGLAYLQVRRLVATGLLAGGQRRVKRTSPKRPWSTAPSHARYFVNRRSLERFSTVHEALLEDLKRRRVVDRARREAAVPVF